MILVMYMIDISFHISFLVTNGPSLGAAHLAHHHPLRWCSPKATTARRMTPMEMKPMVVCTLPGGPGDDSVPWRSQWATDRPWDSPWWNVYDVYVTIGDLGVMPIFVKHQINKWLGPGGLRKTVDSPHQKWDEWPLGWFWGIPNFETR